ncbi:MAG: efflux RND transporter periplasmic adaptor subunit [Microcystaceae cyanobacterium]
MMVESPNQESELAQLTEPATQETLRVEIKASGTVEPIQSVNISPKNPGRLVRLLVEQGDRVKQGQPLAVMENSEIRAAGNEAIANLNGAIANLQKAQVSIPGEIDQAKTRVAQANAQIQEAQSRLKMAQQRIPQQINQSLSQVRAAESRFKLTEARVKRNEALLKDAAISQDTFDEAANDFLTAQANLAEARQRLEQAKTTAPPEISQIQQEINQLGAAAAEATIAYQQRKQTAQAEIAQLVAAKQAAEAELDKIKIQFRDTIITSPFNGIVTQKYTTEGAFVTPTTSASNTASATSSSILALARGLEVVAQVPEVDIGQLQPRQPVKIVADAYPDEVFQGQIIRIAPEAVIEQNVTSFEVTIGIITGQDRLRSKMNVDVTFLGKPVQDAVVVPTVAIVTQKGKTGVMVPDKDQKPQFKPVTIGLVLNEKTQIIDGLMPGEKVFIDLPEDQSEKKDEG